MKKLFLLLFSDNELAKELAERMNEKRINDFAVSEFKIADELKPDFDLCDNSRRSIKCDKKAKHCVSQEYLEISISRDKDHLHLCGSCSVKTIIDNQPIQ